VYAFAAVRYDTDMPQRPFLAFTCAHLTDERLYAAQVAALEGDYECTVFAFRDHDSLGAMAEELLASTPAHFTLIGLSLGGYLAFEIIRRLARPDSHDDLARVRVPTLVMCGRNDPVTPVRDHEAMAATIPGARLEIIENCGHLSTIERPESVNRVLIEWLRNTDGHSLAMRAR
jgi:pimeloyl-ACP methyl ester carboxylesterase